jgi:hypothetical protein
MPAVACYRPLCSTWPAVSDPSGLDFDTYRTDLSSIHRCFLGWFLDTGQADLVTVLAEPRVLAALTQFAGCLVSVGSKISYSNPPSSEAVLDPCCSNSLDRSSKTDLWLSVAKPVDDLQDCGLTLLCPSSYWPQNLGLLPVCHSPGEELEGTCFYSSQAAHSVPSLLGLSGLAGQGLRLRS